ncbi:unnamed protein product, partial [Mesorhabditis belari]|uniref:Ubiquitin carboxyl-terminal hydrolase n=1 Tax=Mesorhabditis belari TaxID=2138241 RepID=A0AAF3EF61_9BILA
MEQVSSRVEGEHVEKMSAPADSIGKTSQQALASTDVIETVTASAKPEQTMPAESQKQDNPFDVAKETIDDLVTATEQSTIINDGDHKEIEDPKLDQSFETAISSHSVNTAILNENVLDHSGMSKDSVGTAILNENVLDGSGMSKDSVETAILNDAAKAALREESQDVTQSSVAEDELNSSKAEKPIVDMPRTDRTAAGQDVDTITASKEEIDDLTKLMAEASFETPSATSNEGAKHIHFETKKISFGEVPLRIVLQKVNGACPLLAIVNALALKGQITLRDVPHVSLAELNEIVGDCLLRLKPELPVNEEGNYNKALTDVINLIPTLNEGLTINVHFRSPHDFEFTPALSLFDLVGLNLVHGWLPDPQLQELCALLGSMSYTQAQIKMIEKEGDTDGLIIGEFLNTTANQLTYYGILALTETLKDGEVAVLFRNNHYSTIYKRRDEIFSLCTDSGFKNTPNVVWETLCVDGDSYFVNSNFKTSASTPVDHQDDAHQVYEHQTDEQIAQSIQDQELAQQLHDHELAVQKKRQESARRQQAQPQGAVPQPAPEPAYQVEHPELPRPKSKSVCSIM